MCVVYWNNGRVAGIYVSYIGLLVVGIHMSYGGILMFGISSSYICDDCGRHVCVVCLDNNGGDLCFAC